MKKWLCSNSLLWLTTIMVVFDQKDILDGEALAPEEEKRKRKTPFNWCCSHQQVSLAGWGSTVCGKVLRFKSSKCILCMAWAYERWVYGACATCLGLLPRSPLSQWCQLWPGCDGGGLPWHHQVTRMCLSMVQWQHHCNGDVIKEPRCGIIHVALYMLRGQYQQYKPNQLDDGSCGSKWLWNNLALVIAH